MAFKSSQSPVLWDWDLENSRSGKTALSVCQCPPSLPRGALGLFLQPLVFILHLVGKIEAPKLPIFPPESLGNSRLGAAGRPGAQIPGLHRARALPATSCLAPLAPLRALGEL